MENNEFNENVNLGNNVVTSGYANVNMDATSIPPVSPAFGQVQTTTGNTITYAETVAAQPVGTVQHMTSHIVEATQTNAETNVNIEKPIDVHRVKTAVLKELVSASRKVGTYSPVRTQSQVVNIEMNMEGLKIVASNGKADYECINRTTKYINPFKVCVDIKKLGDLLNEIDCEYIVLEEQDGNLEITMESTNSKFYLPARIDPATQQVIELGLTFPIKYEDMIDISLDNMVTAINNSKPIRKLPSVKEEFAGTYFTSYVLASDKTIIFMQNNQDILKTQKFFVDGEMCDLITSMNFDKNKFRIGFTTDSENNIIAITLSDGSLTICGGVESDGPIPEEVGKKFWNEQFDDKITVPTTTKFLKALNRIALFMDDMESRQNDSCLFEIANSTMKMKPDNNSAVDNIVIDNPANYQFTFSLPMSKTQTIFNAIKDGNFEVLVSPNTDGKVNIVCLNFGEYKWVISAQQSR